MAFLNPRYNGRVGVYRTNEIERFGTPSPDVTTRIGYNNVDNNSKFVGYYKFTITSTSTTNVGIKIPIVNVIGASIGNTSQINFGLQRVNVIGLTPSTLSSTGWPSGFARGNWGSSNDANYIYISTSNSAQKSALTVGESYWFGFEMDSPSDTPTFQFNQLTTTASLADNYMNCRYESYIPRFGDWVGTYSVSVLDYN